MEAAFEKNVLGTLRDDLFEPLKPIKNLAKTRQQWRVCALIFAKNRSKRYNACSDVAKGYKKDISSTRVKILQKKKRLNYAFACRGTRLARPEGFEPPAFGIGIHCDIQLRHGRI